MCHYGKQRGVYKQLWFDNKLPEPYYNSAAKPAQFL